ncbi:MAG: hypothetical protein Q9M97_02610 [Candidatus Gracilibacteria bacterium]|nr:hypothetical protein [Candidatus Gracilibacteria bacterium]
MIQNKQAESLVGIIVGIFILSFVLLGIGNLIGNSRENISHFDEQMDIDILSKNAYKIINTIDLSALSDGDIFIFIKDKIAKEIKIQTLEEYKYINNSGEKVSNPINYKGKVYERTLEIKKININGEQKTHVQILITKGIP